MPVNINFFLSVFISILFMATSPAQNRLGKIEKQIKEGDYNGALIRLSQIKPGTLQERAQQYLLQAQCHVNLNNEDIAYNSYLNSKALYIEAGNFDKAADINLDIAFLLYAQENNPSDYYKYLDEYFVYANKHADKKKLAEGYNALAAFKIDDGRYYESRKYYLKALELSQDVKDKKLLSAIYSNFAVLYSEYLNKPDSALYYLNKDLAIIEKDRKFNDLCYNYINQAAAYHHKGDYKKAIILLEDANKLPIDQYEVKVKKNIYEFLYKNYEALGDHKNAYRYLLLNKKFSDSINEQEQNVNIHNIQTKYRTKEKELENLKLKSNIYTNRILLYTSIGLLIAAVIIGFLLLKNTRRKQRILKQEKLIEQQRFEKTLKDYELNSIDMMLEGQEKERQRIANDLHDNLGSMLATLKLNFEHLKLRKNELRDEETKLYERTDELIEEAYQKVRRLAHAKNVGVLANEGLIPAVQKLADKVSIPEKLHIEVIPFGFDERIENTLEISIFRMIQELATNIIKHAEATEATIHLTHHEKNINIIVEDNGRGFDIQAISGADGMGITSIQRKAEQLGGTMTIDSTPGKGTTIIIDIPV